MRIWSIHPQHLDCKGLVALWRETLLARNVLLGNTKGYKNHPQLQRFKKSIDPIKSLDFYLHAVWLEAKKRGYNFDQSKYIVPTHNISIKVTDGQIDYEKKHILNKTMIRDNDFYNQQKDIQFIPHPIFKVVSGNIESWEKL